MVWECSCARKTLPVGLKPLSLTCFGMEIFDVSFGVGVLPVVRGRSAQVGTRLRGRGRPEFLLTHPCLSDGTAQRRCLEMATYRHEDLRGRRFS